MNVLIKGGKVEGEVNAIPSKSYAHRIAICNFLAGKNGISDCNGFSSDDIIKTEQCLQALKNGENLLDCGESGSTLRFLLPLVSAIGGDFILSGRGRLMQRPNEELLSVLREHGVKTEAGSCIKINGKLKAGKYVIRGDISSQYVSGLLMALPILDGDSEIVLSTPLVSKPYVDITLEVLSSYGVNILTTPTGYKIKGNSSYVGELKPEGDWSNSAFFLVLGALNGKVTVKGLNQKSVQGDRYITTILEKAGANLSFGDNGLTVTGQTLHAFSFDAENCPDLVPIASVLAGCSKGRSIIENIERLKIKESNRITSTIETLKSFGIKAWCEDNRLIIEGGKVKKGTAESFNDHRIVMSSAVLGACAEGDSTLINAQAVNKSYPTFFEDFRLVGGKAYEL